MAGAVGVGLITGHVLPYPEDDPISLGVVLVIAAAGLPGHYALARRASGGEREAHRIPG